MFSSLTSFFNKHVCIVLAKDTNAPLLSGHRTYFFLLLKLIYVFGVR